MSERSGAAGPAREERAFGGVLQIAGIGIALGLAFNAIGLRARPAWGLDWIGHDRAAAVVSLDDLAPAGAASGAPVTSDDPLALVGGAGGGLPQIPEIDRPIEAGLSQVKRFFDAEAALFVDAREAEEYGEGHIRGAVSIPYDVAAGEPQLLESLDSRGGPIVVYCGGGACELSMNLAYELIYAGHRRVLIYTGGYPEWVEAGYPVASGEPVGR